MKGFWKPLYWTFLTLLGWPIVAWIVSIPMGTIWAVGQSHGIVTAVKASLAMGFFVIPLGWLLDAYWGVVVLVLNVGWWWVVRDAPGLDNKWALMAWGVLVSAGVTAYFHYAWMKRNDWPWNPVSMSVFIGFWVAFVEPRLQVKSLKPGQLSS